MVWASNSGVVVDVVVEVGVVVLVSVLAPGSIEYITGVVVVVVTGGSVVVVLMPGYVVVVVVVGGSVVVVVVSAKMQSKPLTTGKLPSKFAHVVMCIVTERSCGAKTPEAVNAIDEEYGDCPTTNCPSTAESIFCFQKVFMNC